MVTWAAQAGSRPPLSQRNLEAVFFSQIERHRLRITLSATPPGPAASPSHRFAHRGSESSDRGPARWDSGPAPTRPAFPRGRPSERLRDVDPRPAFLHHEVRHRAVRQQNARPLHVLIDGALLAGLEVSLQEIEGLIRQVRERQQRTLPIGTEAEATAHPEGRVAATRRLPGEVPALLRALIFRLVARLICALTYLIRAEFRAERTTGSI